MRRPDPSVGFEVFVVDAEPRLRRALVGAVGAPSVADAVAEALAYAWEHWDRVSSMDNPIGYLYRVAQSKVRAPKRSRSPVAGVELPEDVHPELWDALLGLPARQRTSVWLVHGCRWSYEEVAEALGIAVTSVGTHVARALAGLRRELETATKEAAND